MPIGKDILTRLSERLNLTDYRKTHWEGSFADYLDIVREHPEVTRTAYPDSTATEGDWSAVDLAPLKPLRKPVALREIKSNPRLKEIALVRQSRLSVMPLTDQQFQEIVKMGGK